MTMEGVGGCNYSRVMIRLFSSDEAIQDLYNSLLLSLSLMMTMRVFRYSGV